MIRCSTFGQFFAGMVDGVLIEILPESGWRVMLGLAALPALVMFYGFLSLPESPRWLVQKGRISEAEKVLQSLRESNDEAASELAEILQTVDPVHCREERDSSHDADPNEGDDADGETSLEYGTAPGSLTPVAPTHHRDSDNNVWYRFGQMMADRPTRRALALGCGLMVVQQCSGINTYVCH